MRRIVGLCDESVDDCAMWRKERRDDDVADGRVWACARDWSSLSPVSFR